MEGWQERMGSPNLGRDISGKEKATFSNAACEERKSGGGGGYSHDWTRESPSVG